MNNQLSLVVLAAGMGSRYGGLKQIDAVGPSGETILDYSIHDAMAAGFDKVVFVIRRDIEEDFRSVVGLRYEGSVDVEYVFQELDALPEPFRLPTGRTKPWGTGHAVLMARDLIEGPFGVINADDFYGRDAYERLAVFLKEQSSDGMNYALVGYPLRNTLSPHGSVSRGICSLDANDNLCGVEEVTTIEPLGDGACANGRTFTGDELVSMNLWGFQPTLFDALEKQFGQFLSENGTDQRSEFYIPDAIDQQIRSGTASARVLKTNSKWVGVTYRNDMPTVKKFVSDLVEHGVYPSSLN